MNPSHPDVSDASDARDATAGERRRKCKLRPRYLRLRERPALPANNLLLCFARKATTP